MNQISSIVEKISSAQTAYYNGMEIMSDDEYDALIYELSLIDPSNDILKKIGADPVSGWEKIRHDYPMGSLNKVNLPEEMCKWINDVLKNQPTVIIEKLDGLSLNLKYEKGVLTSSSLRGNGTIGDNILPNVLKMKGVVKYIKDFTGSIRGEIILKKSDHQKYFPDFSNPRNAASGICRRLDGEGCEHLSLLVYDVASDIDFDTEENELKFLKDSGFNVPNYYSCKSHREVNDIWQQYQDKLRDELDWEIDGLVVVASDISTQNALGETNLRPKGKLAFKFANQFIKTTVIAFDWYTASMGRITPRCWFTPVNILGSNIEKASVYNIAYVEKLGLGIGAEVLVCKAGEIIPRVEKVITPAEKSAEIPTTCSSCNANLERDGEYLICPNSSNCPSQVLGRIENWIGSLNILEWGTALLERLVNMGKVKTVADLYSLTIGDLSTIERMGKKSATNCFNTLNKNKELSLDVFLGSLSIPMIGKSMIKLVMGAGFDSLDKILSASKEDFSKIIGFGPNKSESLFVGLKNNKEIIDNLLKAGITVKEKVVGKLNGYAICITGSTNIKRADLQKMIAENGGEYKSGISRSTTHLLVADPETLSVKMQGAQKLGIKIIGEDDFVSLIGA